MSHASSSLPVVRSLPRGFRIEDVFAYFATLPGCLWLDSASAGPVNADGQPIGRYSFLTADPIDSLVASVGDTDPWPKLDSWCRSLPPSTDTLLPPFQGGVAGLIGYEAATWLESVGVARSDDLPTPAISLGLYDWTIAVDHTSGHAWILSQGLAASDPMERYSVACDRADAVEDWLEKAANVCDSETEIARSKATKTKAAGAQVFHNKPPPGVQSNFTSDQFRGTVAEIVRLIREGDSFQVNLSQRLLAKANLSSTDLYLKLRQCNPAPFAAYYSGDGFEVLSSSPEGFLQVRERKVETRPIKGTIPRTGDVIVDGQLAEKLTRSVKDRAENVMIVDLMRNDLSRVCEDDSVIVRQLCELERYEFVQHLVSVVEARLREDATVVDLLRACFPGGSVTGAPKIEAMRTIASLEPNRRGPYCGSIGYVSCGGDADFNILIRTLTAAHGHWQIPVGGGITAQSDPSAEEAETWDKATGMLRAIVDD